MSLTKCRYCNDEHVCHVENADAADEVERLRNPAQGDRVTFAHRIERLVRVALGYRAERDAARTAHTALVADLRALCDEWEAGPWSWLKDTAAPRIRALLDRHAPREGS